MTSTNDDLSDGPWTCSSCGETKASENFSSRQVKLAKKGKEAKCQSCNDELTQAQNSNDDVDVEDTKTGNTDGEDSTEEKDPEKSPEKAEKEDMESEAEETGSSTGKEQTESSSSSKQDDDEGDFVDESKLSKKQRKQMKKERKEAKKERKEAKKRAKKERKKRKKDKKKGKNDTESAGSSSSSSVPTGEDPKPKFSDDEGLAKFSDEDKAKFSSNDEEDKTRFSDDEEQAKQAKFSDEDDDEGEAKFSEDEPDAKSPNQKEETKTKAKFSSEEDNAAFSDVDEEAQFSANEEDEEEKAQFSDDDNAQFSDTEMKEASTDKDKNASSPQEEDKKDALQIPRKKKAPPQEPKDSNNATGSSLIANVEPAKPKPKTIGMMDIDDEDDDGPDANEEEEDEYGNNDQYDNGGSVSVSQLKNRILGRQIRTHDDDDEDDEEHRDNLASQQYSTTHKVSPELRKELSCAICHEVLLHPVSLLCGHSFCQECIKWWWQQSTANDSAKKKSCPTCRQTMPLSKKETELGVNMALRACVVALLGDDLQARLQAEREVKKKATKGENEGAHDAGYEVLTSVQSDGWKQSKRIPWPCRRSIILDAEDQRMQLALGLWKDSTGGGVRFNDREQSLQVSLCLLSMEEDEVADTGFPRIVDDEDDEDNDHLLVTRNGGRFVHSFVRAMVKQQSGGTIPLGRRGITAEGVCAMSLDLSNVNLSASGATVVSFQHEESGATLELRVASNSPRAMAKPPGRSASTALELNDDDDEEGDEKQHDSEEDGSHMDRFEDDGFIADEGEEAEEINDENDLCAICDEGGELIICGAEEVEGCERSFHIACVNHDVVPPGDWICQDCARGAGIEVGIEGYEFPSALDQPCSGCKGEGAHIVCNGGDTVAGCGSAFHLGCVNRTAVPKRDWICKKCARELTLEVGIEGHEFPADGEPIKLSDDNADEEADDFGEDSPATNKKRKRLGKSEDVIKIDSTSDHSDEDKKADEDANAPTRRHIGDDNDSDDEELEVLLPNQSEDDKKADEDAKVARAAMKRHIGDDDDSDDEELEVLPSKPKKRSRVLESDDEDE
ncbi:PHD [Seminavis robusta]|uniref:PHD n=1 Tax=Seminavis robusta TaxID=568900 RepID=A0A9N8H3X0_9STRA|nr:PHD [Seminavis robusta]|eukprot:Sro98_g050620.1 PHD (1068) ;mRNA; f:102296-105499